MSTPHRTQLPALLRPTGFADLPSVAEKLQQLTGEVERMRALLRQHGIEPEDKTA